MPSYDSNVSIAHALFVDLNLGGTNYYISNAYDTITVDGNPYTELGAFLNVGEFVEDFKTTESTFDISLSGIPGGTRFIDIIQGAKIKGGEVSIRRAFFDTDNLNTIAGEVYLRYKGVVSNYQIQENTNFINGQSTNTLVLTIANVFTVLSKKVSGQRTNGSDRRRFFTDDQSFDNVKNLTTLPTFGT